MSNMLFDELTTASQRSPPIISDRRYKDLVDVGVNIGGKLVNEQLGRVGLAVSNAGPDAVAQLSAPKGSGNVSPQSPSVLHTTPSFGVMDYLKAHWKKAAAGVVLIGAVWWFAKKKR